MIENNTRTTIYIDKDLHRRVKKAAADSDCTIKDIITVALNRYLDEEFPIKESRI